MTGDEQPEKFSNSWYYKQFRGQTHILNQLSAEIVGCWDAVRELRERMDSHAKALEEARAEIGELQETIEKARVAFRDLKNEGGE